MTKRKDEIEVKRAPARQPVHATHAAHDWEPIRALRHQIDRLVSEFEWPDFRHAWPVRSGVALPAWTGLGGSVPPVDLVEHNGGYELQAELPGMTKDQIEVRLADGVMTIKGEKSAERIEDDEGYHLRERSFGAFQRSFRLPAGIEADKVEARFENGLLKISLPKSASAIENERKVEIKAG